MRKHFTVTKVPVALSVLRKEQLDLSAVCLVGHRLIVVSAWKTAYLDLNLHAWRYITSAQIFSLPGYPSAHAIDDRLIVFGLEPRSSQLRPPSSFLQVHSLGLVDKVWTGLRVTGDSPPLCRGYSNVYLEKGDAVVVYGGVRVRGVAEYEDKLWAFDTKLCSWSKRQTKGKSPGKRRNHSACLDGSGTLMFLYGGVHADGHLLGDLFVIDLNGHRPGSALAWQEVKCKGVPPPRSGAAFVSLFAGRFLLLSGATQGPWVEDTASYVLETARNKRGEAVWKKVEGVQDRGFGERRAFVLARSGSRPSCHDELKDESDAYTLSGAHIGHSSAPHVAMNGERMVVFGCSPNHYSYYEVTLSETAQ